MTENYLICVAQRVGDSLTTFSNTHYPGRGVNKRGQQPLLSQHNLPSMAIDPLLSSPGMLEFTTQVNRDMVVINCDMR